jgi:5-hydroxyisourate hydrolase
MMSGITTHILDTELGRPAAGVGVTLYCRVDSQWELFASGATDGDGRCRELTADEVVPGEYQLRFATEEYFARAGRRSIYSEVWITFAVREAEHYHLPLLLSANGYSTYRGS